MSPTPQNGSDREKMRKEFNVKFAAIEFASKPDGIYATDVRDIVADWWLDKMFPDVDDWSDIKNCIQCGRKLDLGKWLPKVCPACFYKKPTPSPSGECKHLNRALPVSMDDKDYTRCEDCGEVLEVVPSPKSEDQKCTKHQVVHKNGGYPSCTYPKSEVSGEWEEKFDVKFLEKNRPPKVSPQFDNQLNLVRNIKSFIRSLLSSQRQSLERKHKEWKKRVRLLFDYLNHTEQCVRSNFEAGEPTTTGGYRQKFAGKWYQSRPVDKTPKCDCGLDESIEQVKHLLLNEE